MSPIFSNIKFAKTEEPLKDSKSFPIVKIGYLQRLADAAVCENYGIHGNAPTGTPCLMLIVNNDETNRIVIPLSALTRTRDLEEGEFECGNFVQKSTIFFDKDGNINITATGDINIVAGGGDINITGDVHVTGGIDATDDIVSDTVSLQNHVHSGVDAGGDNSGPPVP